MDISKLSRIVITSGIVLYTADLIMSSIIYTVLAIIPYLPVSKFGNLFLEKASVIAVPLISALLDVLILSIIIMSLKHAEYYGIGKSVVTLIVLIILYFIIASIQLPPNMPSARPIAMGIVITLVVLSAIEIIIMYFYAKIQKELFG